MAALAGFGAPMEVKAPKAPPALFPVSPPPQFVCQDLWSAAECVVRFSHLCALAFKI